MTENLTRSRRTFLDIKTRAEEIETLYAEAAISLPPNSGLGSLIENAKELWHRWFINDVASLNHTMFFRGLHLMRVADVISAIVSTSVVADMREEEPRFHNANQWLVWTMPGLSGAPKKASDELRAIVTGT